MPTLRLDADAKKGVKAFQDLEKAIDKTEKQLELTTREAKKLETAAGRIAKQNEGPQERYNRKMQELANLVKQGKLSMDQAQMAATRYGTSLERAGQKGQNVWGQNALSGIASLVTGYFSVAGAVAAISTALRKVEADNQRVADSFYQGLGSVGQLQQVSGSASEFKQNLGFARSLVARGIFSDIGQASDFTFATTSAGFSAKEKDFLAGVGAKKQVSPEGLTGFAQNLRKVQNLFGPDLAISTAADKLTVTSGGTQADLSQTAAAVAQFSAASTSLGFSGDAALAALVLNEREAKNIDVGATQVAALLDAIDKEGLSKGNLRDSVLGIQSRIAGGENAFEVLKNKRAVKGFRSIAGNITGFDQLTAQIAGAEGTLASRNFIGSDPVTAAAAGKEEAIGLVTDRISSSSEKELLLDELSARYRAREGTSGFGRVLTSADLGIYDLFGTERHAFKEAVTSYRDQLPAEFIGRLEDYLARIASGVEGGTRQEN